MGSKAKALTLLAEFWLLSVIFYRVINVLSYTPFQLTGWSFHGTFVWGSDYFWILLYIIVTSVVLTLLASFLNMVPDSYARRVWIHIIICLFFARFVFALVTWDTSLIWPWLYRHEVARTWLPVSFRTAMGVSLVETMLFGVFLFIYLEIVSFSTKRRSFISSLQILGLTGTISFGLWLYRFTNESFASLDEGFQAMVQAMLFFVLSSVTLMMMQKILSLARKENAAL